MLCAARISARQWLHSLYNVRHNTTLALPPIEKRKIPRTVGLPGIGVGQTKLGDELGKGLISSFTPDRLTLYDWIDAHEKPVITPYLNPKLLMRFTKGPYLHRIYYGHAQNFPPNTKGFLYFHKPTLNPHIASGAIRFRLVPSPDPKLFDQGTDLIMERTGLPWEMPLIHLLTSPCHWALYDALRVDAAVPPAVDHQVRGMLPRAMLTSRRWTGQVLTSILDPFYVDFSLISFRFAILEPDRIAHIDKAHRWMTTHRWSERPKGVPFSGVGLCQFEIHPGAKEREDPKLVVRLLKYLKPPNPADRYKQREGALIQKVGLHGLKPVMRSVDILTSHSLRLLQEHRTCHITE
ncbi:hypothetical protein DFP72DRAFT_1174930 [Ephemerocybe angulata]|uniref:Uncharacterized protein n=1 Tax=Ephemerocybe angulata TaxID=980116 RepID=A0A8H6HIL9_9AGAR|nr:hypothetical protein DFP72DRAFT_1174930 [Tulosesus angulatus]